MMTTITTYSITGGRGYGKSDFERDKTITNLITQVAYLNSKIEKLENKLKDLDMDLNSIDEDIRKLEKKNDSNNK